MGARDHLMARACPFSDTVRAVRDRQGNISGMTTVLVALTALEPSADTLLDMLALSFPISAFRGSPGVWLVEVEQDQPAEARDAENRVGRALSEIDRDWHSVLKLGAADDGVQTG